jgi:hypothetical protein
MLKKYWPSIAHAVAVGVLFLDPSVQAFAATHQAYAAPVVLVWGFLLHRAQSPVSPK